ncbi:MAG TPA: YhcH/YjgK/YiaL family protein [bacterium]|nr:YhcH/YjgK/YiaL family protein [bacterium]
MIVSQLEDWKKYSLIHPYFKKAFGFLLSPELSILPEGRYNIDGKKIYAVISVFSGTHKNEAKLESHKSYIDIQYIDCGINYIGWKNSSTCEYPIAGFDKKKDIIFYEDKPEFYVKLSKSCFAVLFPEDSHAPSVGSGKIRKIVVKVKI